MDHHLHDLRLAQPNKNNEYILMDINGIYYHVQKYGSSCSSYVFYSIQH